jgi:hypothetical protein
LLLPGGAVRIASSGQLQQTQTLADTGLIVGAGTERGIVGCQLGSGIEDVAIDVVVIGGKCLGLFVLNESEEHVAGEADDYGDKPADADSQFCSTGSVLPEDHI